jgi:hypothetical protein
VTFVEAKQLKAINKKLSNSSDELFKIAQKAASKEINVIK